MENSNSLEKILAYKAIKPFLSSDDWDQLGEKLNIDKESLRRTWGKTAEDSFFLIAYSYENVESIIVFNEAISKLTDTPSSDGLILFKDGSKFLIEVKASEKAGWSISKGRVNDQKLLAKKIGLNLLFAIYHNGYWGLYDLDYIERNNYKIAHTNDLEFSLFNSTFQPLVIKIPKGLKIVKHYSYSKKNESFMMGPESGYGYMHRYFIRFDQIQFELNDALQLMAFTAIEAAMINNVTKKKLLDDLHEITHECKDDIGIYDFNFILDAIRVTMSDTNNAYFDSSSFISQALHMQIRSGDINFVQAKRTSFQLIEKLKLIGIPFEIFRVNNKGEKEKT